MGNLEEMDNLKELGTLKKKKNYSLPRLNQEEIENKNRLIKALKSKL